MNIVIRDAEFEPLAVMDVRDAVIDEWRHQCHAIAFSYMPPHMMCGAVQPSDSIAFHVMRSRLHFETTMSRRGPDVSLIVEDGSLSRMLRLASRNPAQVQQQADLIRALNWVLEKHRQPQHERVLCA